MPALEEVNNDAESMLLPPYQVSVRIKGTAPLLFHRWSCEAVQEKSEAAKGSKTKKSDNIESYLWRIGEGKKARLAIPGEYLRQAIISAAKFRQDPRSPRKSAMDLFKAVLICQTELADLGKDRPDYIDQRRVVVQRNGVTRQRPAFEAGWEATFVFSCLMPQYVNPTDLHATLTQAGMLIGVGDFRPTYGRFLVTRFDLS